MRNFTSSVKFTKSILLLLGVVLFTYSLTNAQVKHIDVNPDLVITRSTVGETPSAIDIDNDGAMDFSIYLYKTENEPWTNPSDVFTGITVYIEGEEVSNQVVIPAANDKKASALAAGDIVGSTNQFANYALVFTNGIYTQGSVSSPAVIGNFINSTNKYLGVKFVSGSDTYYGYIGINTTEDSFIITEYGYDQTKDATISIQTTTSVINYLASNSAIRNINNTIIVDFANPFLGRIEVISMTGQSVKEVTVNGITSSFSMEDVPAGIYKVIILGEGGLATKNIFISEY